MAVEAVSKITIAGLIKDRKEILDLVQRLGTVEVRDFGEDFTGLSATNVDKKLEELKKMRKNALKGLDVLNKYTPEKRGLLSSLNGLKELSLEQYIEMEESIQRTAEDVDLILNLERKKEELITNLLKCSENVEKLQEWKNLKIPMSTTETKTTKVFIGSIKQTDTKKSVESIFENTCIQCEKEELLKYVHFEIISKTSDRVFLVVICPKHLAEAAEVVLRKTGFSAPVYSCNDIPQNRISELNQKISECKDGIKDCEDRIKEKGGIRRKLEFLIDYSSTEIDKYKALSILKESKNTFVISGYMASKKVSQLENLLKERWLCSIEHSSGERLDDAPVILSNNRFSAPVEGVLETFSLPAKGETDPTAIMAIFYYFLFGIMLSDAAYGLLMVLICYFLLRRFPKMKKNTQKALRMYFYCGISTVFWGVMFGGYFGDAIQVISSTFFGQEIKIKPLWFSPIKEPMRMLMFSLGIGVVHLFSGLAMRFFALLKAGNIKSAIYDVVFWYLLVGGGIVLLLSTEMFAKMAGLDFVLPTLAARIAGFLMLVGAIGIVLTEGRNSKNPFKRLAKGLYGLYNVTGYLSDILSYSRLLALGLATGVIANVFNKMGSMFGKGLWGTIVFVVVFVIGHTLNLGINLLGAYVHTNRLQFVEFFGKFYQGGGKAFEPLKADTKYYKFENNI